MYKIYFFTFSLFISIVCNSQKRTNTRLILPKNVVSKTLRILFDDGKREENIVYNDIDGFINKEFISEYASIKISYNLSNGESINDLFFVNNQPSIIKYFYSSSETTKLNFILSNAYDFKIQKNKFLEYTKKEFQDCKEFLEKYSDSICINKPLIDSIYRTKFSALSKKEMQYISLNLNDYYLKWYFRRNHLKSNLIDYKSLYNVFKSFPKSYINSEEGIFINNYLNSFTAFKKGEELPFFKAKDITNKFVSLLDYKYKSNVLIVFWATWCVPCINEIPTIRALKSKYKDLEIIFISYDTDKSLFLSKIKEFQMDWVHIFNDIDLINSYGGYKAIPRVYAINKNGQLIYDRDQDKDKDLSMLDIALSKLYK
ncbi:TlpA disulfide reductase family protein [Sediminibacterium sp.]|uniref:TlpA family protein disulfide reductase n=1 Tax=Sediminibacterium sp. TaxID=1917865 RepID=UPI002736EAFF|nr:TlpA disulfide reductase family protein [Sediminibacterium sp.]MDP3394320.1 TlpA disulfide reductase family protein [Sediminibacterium sp.]MDP3568155.1 TlpA disulfide reductase family protein [Sediminibacterium sp.]